MQCRCIYAPDTLGRSTSLMRFFIISRTLITLHILRPHPSPLPSTLAHFKGTKYLAVSTAFLNSFSSPPYSAPALSYISANPALAISKLTSLRIPHLQILTLHTTRSYRSRANNRTRTLRPRTYRVNQSWASTAYGCAVIPKWAPSGASMPARRICSVPAFARSLRVVGTDRSQPQPRRRPPGVWKRRKLSASPTLTAFPKRVRWEETAEGGSCATVGIRRKRRR